LSIEVQLIHNLYIVVQRNSNLIGIAFQCIMDLL